MRIIPVIDLMNGQVVQAIGGLREKYRPVQSVLAAGSVPLDVARALRQETDCDHFYIADLDAIMGRGNQRDVIQELARGLDASLWVDAGIDRVAAAQDLLRAGAARVIVCSEAIPDRETLNAVAAAIAPEQRLFSIDLVNGRVRSRWPSLDSLDPLAALEMLAEQGWSHFIVLELSRVGTGTGPAWQLLETASRRFPNLSLTAGAGVHSARDLERLTKLNIAGVLLATSLHRGWITGKELLELGLRR